MVIRIAAARRMDEALPMEKYVDPEVIPLVLLFGVFALLGAALGVLL